MYSATLYTGVGHLPKAWQARWMVKSPLQGKRQSPPCFRPVLKLLSFGFYMTEGYHFKTFVCSALFGSYSSSAQVIVGSVHYAYKHRHPSCEFPLTSWTVNLTRCFSSEIAGKELLKVWLSFFQRARKVVSRQRTTGWSQSVGICGLNYASCPES